MTDEVSPSTYAGRHRIENLATDPYSEDAFWRMIQVRTAIRERVDHLGMLDWCGLHRHGKSLQCVCLACSYA